MGVQKWIRLDTSIMTNPKILQLREADAYSAIVLYISGLCYSGEQGLAGFIPEVVVPRLADAQRCSTDAQLLLGHSLWSIAAGGYDINSWSEYQASGDEAQRRSEHARKAAQARWAKQNGKEVHRKLTR